MAPGGRREGGLCPAHPVLSGKARPQWPEVAETFPILCWGCWACSILLVEIADIYFPADLTLLPPLQPLQVPSQPRVTPWEQEKRLSLSIYHPSASTALLRVPEQISASSWPLNSSHLSSLGFHTD